MSTKRWVRGGGLYRHFKGGLYKVVDAHVTLEATEEPAVVYRGALERCDIRWVRPREDFLALLPSGGRRFALLDVNEECEECFGEGLIRCECDEDIFGCDHPDKPCTCLHESEEDR